MRISNPPALPLCVSTEMISNWVPNPIKCFLLSVIGQNRPSRAVSIQETPAAACKEMRAPWQNVIFLHALHSEKREIESRRQLFLFLARLACVLSMILLLRWWRAPLLSKFTHQNPIHNNHHLMRRRRVKIWRNGERVHVRDLMCHPSLPALCRLHFIILCVRERELTLPPRHNQKLLDQVNEWMHWKYCLNFPFFIIIVITNQRCGWRAGRRRERRFNEKREKLLSHP